jgi:low temperature requirement protein LtrA
VVVASLWWSYFDWTTYVSEARLREETGRSRAALARDLYSYLHLPMVAGIVLFALGLKTTLAHVDDTLEAVPAFGLFGGIALYLLAHVAIRLRIGGGFGRGRPIAMLVLLAMVPIALEVTALIALSLVALVCVILITYEALRHRASRSFIRSHRGGFTLDEVAETEANLQGRRSRRRVD